MHYVIQNDTDECLKSELWDCFYADKSVTFKQKHNPDQFN